MTQTYKVTHADQAKSLNKVLRSNPPQMRFTKGMAKAARQIEVGHTLNKTVKSSKSK